MAEITLYKHLKKGITVVNTMKIISFTSFCFEM